MAKAIEELKLRFGNVDENYDSGFVSRLSTIAEEAEEVALDLAGGEELSAQQQQDMVRQMRPVEPGAYPSPTPTPYPLPIPLPRLYPRRGRSSPSLSGTWSRWKAGPHPNPKPNPKPSPRPSPRPNLSPNPSPSPSPSRIPERLR